MQLRIIFKEILKYQIKRRFIAEEWLSWYIFYIICSDVSSLWQYFVRLHMMFVPITVCTYCGCIMQSVPVFVVIIEGAIMPRSVFHQGSWCTWQVQRQIQLFRCNNHVPVISAHAVISPNRYCYNGYCVRFCVI